MDSQTNTDTAAGLLPRRSRRLQKRSAKSPTDDAMLDTLTLHGKSAGKHVKCIQKLTVVGSITRPHPDDRNPNSPVADSPSKQSRSPGYPVRRIRNASLGSLSIEQGSVALRPEADFQRVAGFQDRPLNHRWMGGHQRDRPVSSQALLIGLR